MVEDKDTDWRALLENKGLHQEADILEKDWIVCETDVSELEQDYFSELESLGLKRLDAQQLKRFCHKLCMHVPRKCCLPRQLTLRQHTQQQRHYSVPKH